MSLSRTDGTVPGPSATVASRTRVEWMGKVLPAGSRHVCFGVTPGPLDLSARRQASVCSWPVAVGLAVRGLLLA